MIMVLGVGVGLAETAQRSFTFDVGTQEIAKVGSPIVLKIQLKNISDHDLTRMSLPGAADHGEIVGFRPTVRDAEGKEPPLTQWGRQVFGRTFPGEPDLVLNAVGVVPLQPGESWKTQINLNKLYDLSAPGKYTVQIRYYDDEHKEWVTSKTVTVAVVP